MYTSDYKMRTLANSADPDEMPHDAAFHLALRCLLKTIFGEMNTIFLEIITCDLLIYLMDHPGFIVCSSMV